MSDYELTVRRLRPQIADRERVVAQDGPHETHAGMCAGDLTEAIIVITRQLAEEIELTHPSLLLYEAHTENLIERMARVEQHLWPEEWEDGWNGRDAPPASPPSAST